MTDLDVVVRSRRTVLPGGERPAAVAVRDGQIVAVEAYEATLAADDDVDLGDDVLLPGLVDTHVHVNEPGRTEWEGFSTATRAAAAGGVTTLVDMPLNSIPPTVSVDALQAKRDAACGRLWVDVAFWGGAVPGNADQFRPLHDAGVVGFKCFLLDSGVEEFPPCAPDDVEKALRELARFDGLLIAHAEDPDVIANAPAAHGDGFDAFVASRPHAAEVAAVARLITLARQTGARVHIVHLSSAAAIPLVAAARAEGVRLTAETCPHYLALTAEEVPAGATEFKSCPPIREAANREALWRALADGVIECVVSDHSPCTPELKRRDIGDFGLAWGGIASLQLGLPVVWTEARPRGHGLADVVRWMSAAPAALTGRSGKGSIAPGKDADLVAFAPDASFVVDPARLHHRHPVTPYAGRRLTGVVRRTWLRGVEVADRPAGRLVAPDRA